MKSILWLPCFLVPERGNYAEFLLVTVAGLLLAVIKLLAT